MLEVRLGISALSINYMRRIYVLRKGKFLAAAETVRGFGELCANVSCWTDLRLNNPVLITQLLFLDNSLCFRYG